MTRRYRLVPLVLVLALCSAACPFSVKTESDIEQVEKRLDRATNGLNALAKTARELYRQNTINLKERQLIGKVVEEANDGIEKISDRVILVDLANPDSVRLGKIDIEALLRKVIEKLNEFSGNQELQLGIQAVILTVNEAIALVRLVKEVRK